MHLIESKYGGQAQIYILVHTWNFTALLTGHNTTATWALNIYFPCRSQQTSQKIEARREASDSRRGGFRSKWEFKVLRHFSYHLLERLSGLWIQGIPASYTPTPDTQATSTAAQSITTPSTTPPTTPSASAPHIPKLILQRTTPIVPHTTPTTRVSCLSHSTPLSSAMTWILESASDNLDETSSEEDLI